MDEEHDESQALSPRGPPTSAFSNHQNSKNISNLNSDNKYILSIDADDVNDFEIDERIEMDTDKGDTIVQTAKKLGSNLPSPEYKSFIGDVSYASPGDMDDDGNHHSLPEYNSYMTDRGNRIINRHKRRHFNISSQTAGGILLILFGILLSGVLIHNSKDNESSSQNSASSINDDDNAQVRVKDNLRKKGDSYVLEINPSPFNLNEICSSTSIETMKGFMACSRDCNGSQCCFDPKNDPRSCYKQNKKICNQYDVCRVLISADMPSLSIFSSGDDGNVPVNTDDNTKNDDQTSSVADADDGDDDDVASNTINDNASLTSNTNSLYDGDADDGDDDDFTAPINNNDDEVTPNANSVYVPTDADDGDDDNFDTSINDNETFDTNSLNDDAVGGNTDNNDPVPIPIIDEGFDTTTVFAVDDGSAPDSTQSEGGDKNSADDFDQYTVREKLDDDDDDNLPTYNDKDDDDNELFKDDDDGKKQQQDDINDDDTFDGQPQNINKNDEEGNNNNINDDWRS
eukprot:CAMPEP_0194414170 /NCGR_PEP_ID=MMETSP0176-20130528/12772_1 /TAXON_ID=216777 /ORGANISM="Proboscia alata, Strain PI-D3" /LENGTH=513 /DNA_ID=CAMNT_0039217965 /DNA_START=33 /DNA_END=1574 /DNA_ORIENTATION=+